MFEAHYRARGRMAGVLLGSALLLAACGAPDPAAAPTSLPTASAASAPAAPSTLPPQPTLPPPPATADVSTPLASADSTAVTDAPEVALPTQAQSTPALGRATQPPAPPRPNRPTLPPAATAPPASAQDWQPYQSPALGFAARYPAGWVVTEAGSSASFATPDGGAQIVVRTAPGMIEPGQPHDLPANGRCRTVAVGAAAGTRCGNIVTITRTPAADGSTTLVTISASPGIDAATFDAFLQGFVFA